ncbi:MAG: hypothetical protein ACRD1Z_19375 [Vicinamibacteria bacterium]
MTDPELIAKKLGQIETCVRELRTLAQPSRIRQDIREQRFDATLATANVSDFTRFETAGLKVSTVD